ncbi:MAG: hypothetical protein QW412_00285 [Candidatus Aenigmatarchaeota archaeon]
MSQEKSILKRVKKYLKSYFTLPSLLGSATGTTLGYWGSLTAISVYDVLTNKIPQLIQTGNLNVFLYSNYWDTVGKITFVGGISGLLLARRIERSTYYFLKKIFR